MSATADRAGPVLDPHVRVRPKIRAALPRPGCENPARTRAAGQITRGPSAAAPGGTP
ncbi:hypothetical protein ACWEF9_18075 [Streptomyces sp. NPDC004980]